MALNFNNFKTLDLKQIFKEGPRPFDFIWDGFPARSVGSLISLSPGSVGKSFFALEAAVAVAGGADLLGLGPQRTGRVVYFDALNGEDVLAYRLHAIGKYLSQEQKEAVAENLVIELFYGYMPDIMRGDNLDKIIEVGVDSRLIILDPVSFGSSEHTGSEAAILMDTLNDIVEQTGAALLFLRDVAGTSMLVDATKWRGVLRIMDEEEAMVLSDYSFDRGAIGQKRRHLYVHFVSESNYNVFSGGRWLVRDENGVLRPMSLKLARMNRE